MGIYLRGKKLKQKRTYKMLSQVFFHGFEYTTDTSNITYFSYHYIQQGPDTMVVKIVRDSIRFAQSLKSNTFSIIDNIDVSKLSLEYPKIYLAETTQDLSDYGSVSFSIDDNYLYITFKLNDVASVGNFAGFSGFVKYDGKYMVVHRKGIYDTDGKFVKYYPAENPITWSGSDLITASNSISRGNYEQPVVKTTNVYTNVYSYYTSGDYFSLELTERDLGGEYFLVWGFGISGIGAGVSIDNTPVGNLNGFKYQRELMSQISREIFEEVVYG